MPLGRKETGMSKSKRKRIRKRNVGSGKMDDFAFINCPIAGAVLFKSKEGNSLHVFDSIGFMVTDNNNKCFEIEGLVFDKEKGWYDVNEVIPKYYGKEVYPACLDYAVDRAIRDNLYLGLAHFGKERPVRTVLRLSRDEIVRLANRRGIAS